MARADETSGSTSGDARRRLGVDAGGERRILSEDAYGVLRVPITAVGVLSRSCGQLAIHSSISAPYGLNLKRRRHCTPSGVRTAPRFGEGSLPGWRGGTSLDGSPHSWPNRSRGCDMATPASRPPRGLAELGAPRRIVGDGRGHGTDRSSRGPAHRYRLSPSACRRSRRRHLDLSQWDRADRLLLGVGTGAIRSLNCRGSRVQRGHPSLGNARRDGAGGSQPARPLRRSHGRGQDPRWPAGRPGRRPRSHGRPGNGTAGAPAAGEHASAARSAVR